jgi:hypothetical protein
MIIYVNEARMLAKIEPNVRRADVGWIVAEPSTPRMRDAAWTGTQQDGGSACRTTIMPIITGDQPFRLWNRNDATCRNFCTLCSSVILHGTEYPMGVFSSARFEPASPARMAPR